MRRFDECLAKQILSACYPDVYGKIEIRDKPDLWCMDKGIGVEVTTSTTQKEAEVLNLWMTIKQSNGVGQERRIERLKKLGYEYKEVLEWKPDDFILSHFYRAIERKIKKLNSRASNYKEMEDYHLFIHSILEVEFGQQFEIEKQVREILRASQGKTFSAVHFLTRTTAFYTFFKSDKHPEERHFYNAISRFVADAEKEKRDLQGKNP